MLGALPALFSDPETERICGLPDNDFAAVTHKSYMGGYRDTYHDVGLFHRLMIRFCDSTVKMRIVRIVFKEREI